MRTHRASQGPSAGFTLVEMMIVCTLVAVLAAVSIPMIKIYQEHISNKAALRVGKGVRTALVASIATTGTFPKITSHNQLANLCTRNGFYLTPLNPADSKQAPRIALDKFTCQALDIDDGGIAFNTCATGVPIRDFTATFTVEGSDKQLLMTSWAGNRLIEPEVAQNLQSELPSLFESAASTGALPLLN